MENQKDQIRRVELLERIDSLTPDEEIELRKLQEESDKRLSDELQPQINNLRKLLKGKK